MNSYPQFLSEVYSCKCCPAEYGFTSPTPDDPYFKFPPTIGALGRAELLFVGINPRISMDNHQLHERLMAQKAAFAALAENQDGDQPYISRGCEEQHYHHHVAIVESLFGKNARFEDHAAVTELFYCATTNAMHLPQGATPCADLYFDRVFLRVRPRLVICVWKTALNYFRRRAGVVAGENLLVTIGGHSAVVVFLPHPNGHH